MDNEKIIIVRGARLVPVLLLISAVWMGLATSSWWFLSIPFVAVGWICAVPNLNLANGMLAYLSMIAGFILLKFHQPSGTAILAGAAAGFYLSALEMRIMAQPYTAGNTRGSENEDPTKKARLDNRR